MNSTYKLELQLEIDEIAKLTADGFVDVLNGVRIESTAGGFGFSHVLYGGGGAEEGERTCREDRSERKFEGLFEVYFLQKNKIRVLCGSADQVLGGIAL